MMDRFNDLEVLIDSQYPIICIETHEEARVEEILTRICSESGLPFFHWVATAGLTPGKSRSLSTIPGRQWKYSILSAAPPLMPCT